MARRRQRGPHARGFPALDTDRRQAKRIVHMGIRREHVAILAGQETIPTRPGIDPAQARDRFVRRRLKLRCTAGYWLPMIQVL